MARADRRREDREQRKKVAHEHANGFRSQRRRTAKALVQLYRNPNSRV